MNYVLNANNHISNIKLIVRLKTHSKANFNIHNDENEVDLICSILVTEIDKTQLN